MKFLIIMKPRPVDMPSETRIKMFEKAREWIKSRQASGELKEVYSFENGGAVVITDIESSIALQTAIWTFPLAPLVQYELYPLMDADKSFELQLEMLRNYNN